jgi:hypothetical protein
VNVSSSQLRAPPYANNTAIFMIIECQLQVSQRFSSCKLVLKIVGSRFAALNYYENGSACIQSDSRADVDLLKSSKSGD